MRTEGYARAGMLHPGDPLPGDADDSSTFPGRQDYSDEYITLEVHDMKSSSSGAMPILLNYLAKGFVILFALPVLGVWVAGSLICAIIAPIAACCGPSESVP